MSNQNVGLFPSCYRVSRDNMGGETATFKWLVNAVTQTVTGTGHLTQPINPPTDITVEMKGSYVEDPEQGIIVHAAGSLPGASIQVVLIFDKWGGSGQANSLRWLANNHYFSDEDVPAKSIDCFG